MKNPGWRERLQVRLRHRRRTLPAPLAPCKYGIGLYEQLETLSRYQGARQGDGELAGDDVQHIVVIIGLVMEGDKALRRRLPTKTDTLLPR